MENELRKMQDFINSQKQERLRLEGKQESCIDALKKEGYKSSKEARAAIDAMSKKYKEVKESLEQMYKEFKKKFGKKLKEFENE